MEGGRLRQQPEFSVIVPTFNRSEVLRHVLRSWARQSPAEVDFEVIVIDDGSRDGTQAVLDAHRNNRYTLRTRWQSNQGPAAARNLALGMARGRYVLFSGDDIEPSKCLLRRHLERHRIVDDERFAVLGKIEWAPAISLTSTMKHVDGVGAQQFSYRFMKDGDEYDFRHFYTSNVSVSRDLLDKEPSGFSTDFSLAAFEDAEFAFRLRRHGLRILYESSAVAFHHHPYDAKSFFRRQVACGQMGAVLMRKWPKTASIIGGDEVIRSAWKARLQYGKTRRAIRRIESELDVNEKLAIQIASAFDDRTSDGLDQYLSGLFGYAYQKGMAGAVLSPEKALRVSAYCFLNLVGSGAVAVRETLDGEDLEKVEPALSGLLANCGLQ